MLQLLKHHCSVFEGMMLFSDVCVPQYQAVIEQVPGKLSISCFRKASLGNVLLHRCVGDQAGLGHVLIWAAIGAYTSQTFQAKQAKIHLEALSVWVACLTEHTRSHHLMNQGWEAKFIPAEDLAGKGWYVLKEEGRQLVSPRD